MSKKDKFNKPNPENGVDTENIFSEESLSIFDDFGEDRILLDSVDKELIDLGGSEISIYKYIGENNFDDLYDEDRIKVLEPVPKIVYGHFEPVAIEQPLNEFGLTKEADFEFTFNKNNIDKLLGRPLKPGDVLKPSFIDWYFRVYEVQEDSFESYGVYHYSIKADLWRDGEYVQKLKQSRVGSTSVLQERSIVIELSDGYWTTVDLRWIERGVQGVKIPIMLVSHGGPGKRQSVSGRAKFWAETGFFSIAFDSRGRGGSMATLNNAALFGRTFETNIRTRLDPFETINILFYHAGFRNIMEETKIFANGYSVGGIRTLFMAMDSLSQYPKECGTVQEVHIRNNVPNITSGTPTRGGDPSKFSQDIIDLFKKDWHHPAIDFKFYRKGWQPSDIIEMPQKTIADAGYWVNPQRNKIYNSNTSWRIKEINSNGDTQFLREWDIKKSDLNTVDEFFPFVKSVAGGGSLYNSSSHLFDNGGMGLRVQTTYINFVNKHINTWRDLYSYQGWDEFFGVDGKPKGFNLGYQKSPPPGIHTSPWQEMLGSYGFEINDPTFVLRWGIGRFKTNDFVWATSSTMPDFVHLAYNPYNFHVGLGEIAIPSDASRVNFRKTTIRNLLLGPHPGFQIPQDEFDDIHDACSIIIQDSDLSTGDRRAALINFVENDMNQIPDNIPYVVKGQRRIPTGDVRIQLAGFDTYYYVNRYEPKLMKGDYKPFISSRYSLMRDKDSKGEWGAGFMEKIEKTKTNIFWRMTQDDLFYPVNLMGELMQRRIDNEESGFTYFTILAGGSHGTIGYGNEFVKAYEKTFDSSIDARNNSAEANFLLNDAFPYKYAKKTNIFNSNKFKHSIIPKDIPSYQSQNTVINYVEYDSYPPPVESNIIFNLSNLTGWSPELDYTISPGIHTVIPGGGGGTVGVKTGPWNITTIRQLYFAYSQFSYLSPYRLMTDVFDEFGTVKTPYFTSSVHVFDNTLSFSEDKLLVGPIQASFTVSANIESQGQYQMYAGLFEYDAQTETKRFIVGGGFGTASATPPALPIETFNFEFDTYAYVLRSDRVYSVEFQLISHKRVAWVAAEDTGGFGSKFPISNGAFISIPSFNDFKLKVDLGSAKIVIPTNNSLVPIKW